MSHPRLEKEKGREMQPAEEGRCLGNAALPRSVSSTGEGGREPGIISAALPFRVKSEPERKSVNLNPLLKGNN